MSKTRQQLYFEMLNQSAEYAMKVVHELGPYMHDGNYAPVAIPSDKLYVLAANYLSLYKEANAKHGESKLYNQARLIH